MKGSLCGMNGEREREGQKAQEGSKLWAYDLVGVLQRNRTNCRYIDKLGHLLWELPKWR